MPRLTARGVLFLLAGGAVLAVAYLLERPELLAVGVIAIAAPLVALAVVAAGRPRVRISRHLDPVVATAGEPVRVTVTVAGRARAAEWIERVPMRPGFAGPGRLAEVRRTRPRTLGYRYWPVRRGIASIGPLLIEDRDPFALAVRVTNTVSETAQLVIPAIVPLQAGPVPDPSTETGPRTSLSRDRADDDVITREYRDGDALRRVHWRVTARHGELMVRQDEPQAGPRSRLLIDTSIAGYPDADARRAPVSAGFEWVVAMAASAAAHLSERGYAVDLSTSTPQEPGAPSADAPGIPSSVAGVLGELALLDLGPAGSETPAASASSSVPVVAIASAPDVTTLQWMLAQRSGGGIGVLLLADPSPPAELVDLFERAGWTVAAVPVGTPADAAWRVLGGHQLEGQGAPSAATGVLT